MRCLATYLRFYFLSTMFYSFQNKNFVILLLNLFYFYAIVNEAVSLISFHSDYKHIEIQSTLYTTTLLNSFISYNSIFSSFLRISYTHYHVIYSFTSAF